MSQKYVIIVENMRLDFNPATIKMIFALGNPDKVHENTYHNSGLLFLENLINKIGNSRGLEKTGAKTFAYLKTDKLILAKSLVFMNLSGEAVKKAAQYFKIKSSEILLAHDDSDLNIGKYKIVFDQRSAGHKGVDSVINDLRTQKLWRLKIGIRPVDEIKRQKAEKFVLKKINVKNQAIFAKVFEEINGLFTAY